MSEERIFQIMSTDFEVDHKQRATAYKRLVALVKNHGIGVIRSMDDRYKYGWNGKQFRIDEPARSTSMRALGDLAHEFAHFLCASPARRYHLEFGLGQGFSTSGTEAKELTSSEVIQTEENCACVLAAIMLNHLGIPNLKESIWVNFLWYDGFKTTCPPKWSQWVAAGEIDYIVRTLLTWGVIDADMNPTFKAREIIEDPRHFTLQSSAA